MHEEVSHTLMKGQFAGNYHIWDTLGLNELKRTWYHGFEFPVDFLIKLLGYFEFSRHRYEAVNL